MIGDIGEGKHHLTELEVVDVLIDDGNVIIEFNNGQKLIEGEARELAQNISEFITMGLFIKYTALEKLKDTRAQAQEFKSSLPHRCEHHALNNPDAPQCMLEADHEGEHEYHLDPA